MPNDTPEPLWREVVGDPEPWRRGRIIVATIAVLNALVHALSFYIALLVGSVERALALAIVVVLWWLMFAFIWFGTHWLRWLLGGYALLIGFAEMIWAFRDGTPLRFITVVVNFGIGAALFAPSVHFFAVRQRERIKWPEKLVVGIVFLLLVGSFTFALVGFSLHRAAVQKDATRYAAHALDKLFVANDTNFLFEEASPAFSSKYGQGGLSGLMARRYMQTGDVRDLRIVDSQLRTYFAYPMTVGHSGPITATAVAECGPVQLTVEILRDGGDWKVHGFWWRCLDR